LSSADGTAQILEDVSNFHRLSRRGNQQHRQPPAPHRRGLGARQNAQPGQLDRRQAQVVGGGCGSGWRRFGTLEFSSHTLKVRNSCARKIESFFAGGCNNFPLTAAANAIAKKPTKLCEIRGGVARLSGVKFWFAKAVPPEL